LLPLAFSPHWIAAGISFIGVSMSYALVTPVLTLSQQEIVPASWRATMSGTAITARGLGTAMMAFGGGYVIISWGYPSLFLSGAILALIGAGLIWLYSWAPRRILMREKHVSPS
jgi:predicted MFS family arabinose efflux permease